VVARQQADGQPAGRLGAASRVFHHAGQPAADQDRMTLRNAAAQLEGQIRE
jgi:hypothetical protein